MENQILIAVMAISGIVFVVTTLYYYPDVVRKLVTRLGTGILGILGANWIMAATGLGLYVGINPLTGLILTVLGCPGLLLLYGMEAYSRFFF